VALLDYLGNKQSILRGARLVGRGEFEVLLSQVDVDDLTQVYNRRYFTEQLNRELDRARRYGSKVSLLLVDVDNFKLYNDTRGHVAGDTALGEVAAALSRSARTTDLVCRYGGDEFAVICPRTVKHDALTLADRLRKAVKETDLRPDLKAGAQPLSLSVGVATYPDDADESVALVEAADQALYRAKEEADRLASYDGG
jgi:diguanylate cyclase (GGDEF)-like protein